MNGTGMQSPLEHIGVCGEMAVRPEAEGLRAARRHINSVACGLGFGEEESADLVLAVGEAISNAFIHGTPDRTRNLIYVGWHFKGDILTITVKDEGPGFSPYEVPRPSPTRLRGKGINLMRRCVDGVHFEFDRGARVVLEKRTPTGALHYA